MNLNRRVPSHIRRVESEFFRTMATLVVSAFSLVAALAWNTAITKILDLYLSQPGSNIFSWLVYAIIVTLVAVIVTIYTSRLAERFGAENDQPTQSKEG